MGNKQAKNQVREGKAERNRIGGQIDNFSYSDPQFREGLNNPFAGVTNTFAGATNAFGNQRVATGAADYQTQQNDQNQASVLDAIRQGGGAGGATATALAQQSRAGNQQIAAGLQSQEANINQQIAQGEQTRQTQISEGEARRQQLYGSGQQFTTQVAEGRASAELAGLGNQYAGAQQTINAGYENIASNNAAIWGAVGSVAGAAVSAFNPLGKLTGK